MNYDPKNWYWIVANDTSRAWSSAANAYVLAADAMFLAWLADGNVPTAIDTEENLWDVMRAANVPPFHSISTSALVARLEASGKADAADEYMSTHRPLRRRFYTVGRFFADDPDLNAMLDAISADVSVLLAPDLAA
jgi:hypothetical protein